MQFRFRRANRTVTRSELFVDDKPWIVWWYRGFVPNTSSRNYQPGIETEFRQVGKSGEVLPIIRYIRILVSDISFFSIGSVWQNGICIQESQLQENTFALDFANGWRFRSLIPEQPFPTELYKPDWYRLNESWMLEFDLKIGGKLLIPCIEFFSRCYGFSGEVKRILTTYPWDECVNRLYVPPERPDESGKWNICIATRIPDCDAVMLASARYRQETQRALSSIHSQLIAQFTNQKLLGKNEHRPVPMKVGPWYHQPAKLIVEGMSFGPNNTSFIGLRITGFSEPDGPPIFLSHQKGDKAENPAPPDSKPAWDGARTTTRIQVPDSVVVTGFTDPEPGMQRVEAETPSLKIIGKRRAVHTVVSHQALYSTGKAISGEEASLFSSGMVEKNGQGVGELSVQTRGISVMDSEGVVRDLWNALQTLKETKPELIRELEWYTPKNGFSSSSSPEYIAFAPGSKLMAKLYNWCHTDSYQLHPRGALLIRLTLSDLTAYIVEIERRPPRSQDENAQEDETFRGVIFTHTEEIDIPTWIEKFMRLARLHEGRVVKFIGEMPGQAFIFKHPSAKNDMHPGFPSVRNALDKIGVAVTL